MTNLARIRNSALNLVGGRAGSTAPLLAFELVGGRAGSTAPLLAFELVAMMAVGCAASSPPPPPVAAGGPPPAPAAVGSDVASSNALVSPLNAAPSNGTATPMDPALAGAAAAILNQFAANLAPGMSREGNPMAATFQPGQTMEQVVQLQTGRCYTVVAAGPMVQAWDFSLVLVNPLPTPPVVVAHESQNGTVAALAGNGHCFQWSWLPTQARVIVQVTQGGGVAVAQVYGK